jgi:hypothetical protein
MYGAFLIYNEYLALLDIIREQKTEKEYIKIQKYMVDSNIKLVQFGKEIKNIIGGDVAKAAKYFEICKTILMVEATPILKTP